MSSQDSLSKLRDILAVFYPDELSIRRLLDDAGLEARYIKFDAAINTWHNILLRAMRTNEVNNLLDIILRDGYENNDNLRQACEDYRTYTLQSSNSMPDISRSVGEINTSDGRLEPILPKSDLKRKILYLVLSIIFFLVVMSFDRHGFWQGFRAGSIDFIDDLTHTTQKDNSIPKLGVTYTLEATPMAKLVTSAHQALTTFTNPKDGAVYIWILPGEFMMGSSITDTLVYTNERPQHKVVLDGFWIMLTEVTNAQYKLCVEANVCQKPNNSRWADRTYEKHPVVDISWEDAETYANWVDGRLPTEAEWEKACRGADKRIYPWGNQAPTAQLLNYKESNKGDTMPTGSYPPGANGLYDMSGNVWEWTADWYRADYYAHSPEQKPRGPTNGLYRTFRGGSFRNYDYDIRCAVRLDDDPNFRDDHVGFRVVSDGF